MTTLTLQEHAFLWDVDRIPLGVGLRCQQPRYRPRRY